MRRLLVNLLVIVSLAWAGMAIVAEPAPTGKESPKFYIHQG